MKFDAYAWEKKSVKDPTLGFAKDLMTLNFHVVELNGETVSTVYSITASTLQAAFKPYLDKDKYLAYRFSITRDGTGYAPPRIASAVPI
jgi:hypothetical protein